MSVLFAADPQPEKIDITAPRAQIRAEILDRTKLGSSPDDVLKFINREFKPKKDSSPPALANHPAVGPTAAKSDKQGAQSIRLVLGRYTPNPGLLFLDVPVIAKTTVSVQWAFNKEGKLLEVFVDKDTELGDAKGP